MEPFLCITLIATTLAGVSQVIQHGIARRIQKLVLAGTKFHLALNSSGAVELRSGTRQGVLTQKEANQLAPALRLLVSRVRWIPGLGLRLLSKNQGNIQAQSIEDSFTKAAIESQRQELILLAEDRGIRGGAVELIMGVERDEDFAKLWAAINTAPFGADLPETLAQELQLKDPRMLEPLVLWSSKPTPGAKTPAAVELLPAPRQIDTGKPGVVEETVPALPGYTLRTRLKDRGRPYESVVVEIRHSGQIVASNEAYLKVYSDELEEKILEMKGELVQRIKALSAAGL